MFHEAFVIFYLLLCYHKIAILCGTMMGDWTGNHVPGFQFLLGFLVFAFFEEPYSLFTLHTGPKVQEKSSGFQVCRKEQDKTALGFPLS